MQQRENSLLIGITGGIGSGKSTVANIIRNNGYNVIFSDDLAKQIISENEQVKKKIIEAFGEQSYIDGEYNVKYISDIVFESKESDLNLQTLNRIVHPAVIERLIDEIERLQNNKIEVIFIESALIFELGLDEGFDYVVSVTASNKNRINRIKTRSGLTDAQIVRRMKQQLSQEEKNKNSDFVIENDKDMKALESSVNFLMPIILTLPNKDDSNEYDGED